MRHLITAIVFTLAAAGADQPRTVGIEMQGNMVFVKASIGNSEPLDMALDTGTVYSTLDEAVATKLGLDLSMKAQSSGMKGMQEISILKNQTLKFCGLEINEPLMVSYPLGFLSKRIGRRVDGIIGIELLKKHVVELDYPGRRVRIYAPETFAYAGPGEAVPITYDSRHLPLINGSVTPYGKQPIPVRFQVDSGGAATHAMFWKSFIEKQDLASSARGMKEVQVTAFTGTKTQKQGRVQAIRFGKVVVNDPEVGFNDYEGCDPTVCDSNLGSGFLTKFKVIFDLPHDRMILEWPAGS
jgi:hypothetical protein